MTNTHGGHFISAVRTRPLS